MNNPAVVLLSLLGGWYLGKLWYDDWRLDRRGQAHAHALPGTTAASRGAMIIASLGALLLVAAETLGEYGLGIADQQSKITWLFALYSITAAPIVEEVIFRGWLLIQNRGRLVLWTGVLGASLLFALLHPFLWRWEDAGFELTLGVKGAFSTAMVFLTSVWLYYARVATWNPNRSLLPCIAAHAAKNAGVIAVKAATGFVSGCW
jgi:membrane protease YdiL (CAAX protease family)